MHPIILGVIPGWCAAPDPESRDSGFDASHRPGMTVLEALFCWLLFQSDSEERPRGQVCAVCVDLTARRVSKDGRRASWFETAQERLLTIRVTPRAAAGGRRDRAGA